MAFKPDESSEPLRATVSVYQNDDYVAEMLQQLVNKGLVKTEEAEVLSKVASDRASSKKAGVTAGAGTDMPLVAKAEAKLNGELQSTSTRGNEDHHNSRFTYEYNRAFYLHRVRRLIQDHLPMTVVTGAKDAEGLSSGDLVEFEATFEANQTDALLDIATPDFVRSIALFLERRKSITGMSNLNNFDEMQRYIEKRRFEETAKSEFAASVAQALRIDFRSSATRRYFGRVGSEVDAITFSTICESRYFIVEDENRLLDGRFRVVAKVIGEAREDEFVLAGNKVLSRLNPSFLDDLFARLQADAETTVKTSARSTGDDAPSTPGDETPIDTRFRAVVPGTSIPVMPIAIFI